MKYKKSNFNRRDSDASCEEKKEANSGNNIIMNYDMLDDEKIRFYREFENNKICPEIINLSSKKNTQQNEEEKMNTYNNINNDTI